MGVTVSEREQEGAKVQIRGPTKSKQAFSLGTSARPGGVLLHALFLAAFIRGPLEDFPTSLKVPRTSGGQWAPYVPPARGLLLLVTQTVQGLQ